MSIIRVEMGAEVRSKSKASKWHWTCPELGLSGLNRSPLLDACRAIKRMGGLSPRQQIGLYREGRDRPDMFCALEVGAGLDVREDENVGPVLVKWQEPSHWLKRKTPAGHGGGLGR
jgi:hypothetical protein